GLADHLDRTTLVVRLVPGPAQNAGSGGGGGPGTGDAGPLGVKPPGVGGPDGVGEVTGPIDGPPAIDAGPVIIPGATGPEPASAANSVHSFRSCPCHCRMPTLTLTPRPTSAWAISSRPCSRGYCCRSAKNFSSRPNAPMFRKKMPSANPFSGTRTKLVNSRRVLCGPLCTSRTAAMPCDPVP